VNMKIYMVRVTRESYPISTGEWNYIAQAWPCPCELEPFFFPTPWKWRLPEPFIAQGRTVITSPKTRQLISGQVKPYAIGHHWPGVANDVFNDVDTPSLIVCLTALGQCGAVLLRRWAL
jgi:hypothetical protein